MANIGIIVADGDVPIQNALIEAIRDEALNLAHLRGIERVYGFHGGFTSLAPLSPSKNGPMVEDLTRKPIDPTDFKCILSASRSRIGLYNFTEEKKKEFIESFQSTLRTYNLKYFVVLSGIRGISDFKRSFDILKEHIEGYVVVPKSMNNDIGRRDPQWVAQGPIYNVGFASAVRSIVELTRRMRAGSENFNKITLVQYLGGITGWPTAGAKAGDADIVCLPESFLERDPELILDELAEKVRDTHSIHNVALVALSESLPRNIEEQKALKAAYQRALVDKDFSGYDRFSREGREVHFACELEKRLKEGNYWQSKVTAEKIGHLARWAEPADLDIYLSRLYGRKAIHNLFDGEYQTMPFITLDHIRRVKNPFELGIDAIRTIGLEHCILQPIPDSFLSGDGILGISDEFLGLLKKLCLRNPQGGEEGLLVRQAYGQ